MSDLASFLKKLVVTPKVYAIVVSSPRGSILHLGVYPSLDGAFDAAKNDLVMFTPHKNRDNIEIDYWACISGRDVIMALGDPNNIDVPVSVMANEKVLAAPTPTQTTADFVKLIRDQKNELIKKIIDTQDLSAIKNAGQVLTRSEVKFISNKINEDINTKEKNNVLEKK